MRSSSSHTRLSHEGVLGLRCVTFDSGEVKGWKRLPIGDVQIRSRVISAIGSQTYNLVTQPVQLIVAAAADFKLLNKRSAKIVHIFEANTTFSLRSETPVLARGG